MDSFLFGQKFCESHLLHVRSIISTLLHPFDRKHLNSTENFVLDTLSRLDYSWPMIYIHLFNTVAGVCKLIRLITAQRIVFWHCQTSFQSRQMFRWINCEWDLFKFKKRRWPSEIWAEKSPNARNHSCRCRRKAHNMRVKLSDEKFWNYHEYLRQNYAASFSKIFKFCVKLLKFL